MEAIYKKSIEFDLRAMNRFHEGVQSLIQFCNEREGIYVLHVVVPQIVVGHWRYSVPVTIYVACESIDREHATIELDRARTVLSKMVASVAEKFPVYQWKIGYRQSLDLPTQVFQEPSQKKPPLVPGNLPVAEMLIHLPYSEENIADRY